MRIPAAAIYHNPAVAVDANGAGSVRRCRGDGLLDTPGGDPFGARTKANPVQK